MKKISRLFVCAGLLLGLNACAFGSKMKFSDTRVEVPKTAASLAVAASDQRPAVLSGEKTPQWVGLQRSGFGIPYGVHISSGATLADEFRDSLLHSFPNATAATLSSPGDPLAQFKQQVTSRSAQKGVLLIIRDWKTDVYTNINLDYDLEIVVTDKNGKELARERAASHDKLAGSFWNPIGASERVARESQKKILDQLFSRPTIRQALG